MTRWKWRWAPWLVALSAILVYSNTFQAGFTLDDVPIIEENLLIRSLDNIPRIFRTNYWGEGDKPSDRSLYRPLTIASYAVNHAVHGLDPVGYHVTNILLHALVSVLLLLTVRLVFENEMAAFVAAAMFAVHPIHTEAVAGVVGRAEILSLLGLVVCVLSYEQARRAAGSRLKYRTWSWLGVSVAGYGVAMFSKEIGVVTPAIILLTEAVHDRRRWLLKLHAAPMIAFGCYATVFGVFMLMRNHAILTRNINIGFVGVSTDDRIWTSLRVCLEYVGMLVVPVRLSADYHVTDVPIADTPWDPAVLAALTLVVGAAVFGIRYGRRLPMIVWGLGLFAISLFPVSNILFAIGVMKAERILYSPSAGLVVAMAGIMTCGADNTVWRRAGMIVAVCLGVFYTGRTWTRNRDWQNNWTLAVATLATSPDSPLFNNIMAQEYRKRKPPDNKKARDHLLTSVQQNPRDASNWFNLGNTHLDLQEYDQAIECYRRAIAIAPEPADYHLNLGMAHHNAGQYAQAADIFERELRKRPHILGLYFNLVSCRVNLRQPDLALPVAEEAVKRFPHNAGAWLNLSLVQAQLGRTNDAVNARAKALALDPNIEQNRNQRSRLE
jgi:cytochrome c-type biogenesis protein CcmH/NrfG